MPHQCIRCAFRGGAGAFACQHDSRLARQPETALEVPLLLRPFRQVRHAFGDFYDALLALALLSTGRGNLYAQPFAAIEERGPVGRLDRLSVDGDGYQSALASRSTLTASATSSAEPSRSSSSLHFHRSEERRVG